MDREMTNEREVNCEIRKRMPTRIVNQKSKIEFEKAMEPGESTCV